MSEQQLIDKSAEQRAFEQLQGLTAVNRQGLRFIDRVFKPLFASFTIMLGIGKRMPVLH